MKRTALLLSLAMALPATADAQAVSAEPWFRAGTLMLGVEVGGAAFSDFERTRARPVDGSIELSDFSRRVSARTSGSVGAWASYWIFDGLGVRLGGSWTPTRFRVWNEEQAQQVLESISGDVNEPSYASLGVWLLNGAALIKSPRSFGRVVPYGIVGGGWVMYSADDSEELPPEARSALEGRRLESGALLLGLGATIPLQRENLLMSFELTTNMARSPLRGHGHQVFELSGVPMEISADDMGGNDDVGIAHHVRLAFALTLPIR